MLKPTNNLNKFKDNLKEHYLKELKNYNSCQLFILKATVCNIPSLALYLKNYSQQHSLLLIFIQFLNRYYSTFVAGPQCKYKQFDACFVLSCPQQKCYLSFALTFLISFCYYLFLIFNLVFNHFFVIFHTFFVIYLLTYTLLMLSI